MGRQVHEKKVPQYKKTVAAEFQMQAILLSILVILAGVLMLPILSPAKRRSRMDDSCHWSNMRLQDSASEALEDTTQPLIESSDLTEGEDFTQAWSHGLGASNDNEEDETRRVLQSTLRMGGSIEDNIIDPSRKVLDAFPIVNASDIMKSAERSSEMRPMVSYNSLYKPVQFLVGRDPIDVKLTGSEESAWNMTEEYCAKHEAHRF